MYLYVVGTVRTFQRLSSTGIRSRKHYQDIYIYINLFMYVAGIVRTCQRLSFTGIRSRTNYKYILFIYKLQQPSGHASQLQALATDREGVAHGDGSHVKDARVLNSRKTSCSNKQSPYNHQPTPETNIATFCPAPAADDAHHVQQKNGRQIATFCPKHPATRCTACQRVSKKKNAIHTRVFVYESLSARRSTQRKTSGDDAIIAAWHL